MSFHKAFERFFLTVEIGNRISGCLSQAESESECESSKKKDAHPGHQNIFHTLANNNKSTDKAFLRNGKKSKV